MNQPLDYKKLSHQIGFVITEIITIIGNILLLVSVIEIERYGTNRALYLDSYDYNLLTMRTYSIAIALGGFISHLVYIFLNAKSAYIPNTNTPAEPKPALVECEICGIKTDSPITVTLNENQEINVCPYCYTHETIDVMKKTTE